MENLTQEIFDCLCKIEEAVKPLYASGQLTENDTIVATDTAVKGVVDKCCYTFEKARNYDGFAIKPTSDEYKYELK